MTNKNAGGRPCHYRVVGGALALLGTLAIGMIWPAQPGFAKESKADIDVGWGVKMARRGLWSEAMFRFREATELEPNNAHFLNNLAVSLEAVGMFDEALEAYQRALKIDSTSRDLRQNYARFVEFYQAFKGPDEAAQEPTVDPNLNPNLDPNAEPPSADELPEEPVDDDDPGR